MKTIYSNKENLQPKKVVTSARGIILKDDLILLTYSNHFQDYTTPGGRMEENEPIETTLKRELKEEIGFEKITYQPVGVINEYYMHEGEFILKKHHYYLITDYIKGKTNRKSDEVGYGMESRWVSLDEAISQNSIQIDNRLNNGLSEDNPFITTMDREIKILTYIKEHLL